MILSPEDLHEVYFPSDLGRTTQLPNLWMEEVLPPGEQHGLSFKEAAATASAALPHPAGTPSGLGLLLLFILAAASAPLRAHIKFSCVVCLWQAH